MPKKKVVEKVEEVRDVCVCGKPNTYTNNDGERFCSLSCETNK